MRILLVQSPLGNKQLRVYPIGLAQIAGQLEKHDVKGFDPNTADDYLPKLNWLCDSFDPEIIGVSFRNLDTARSYKPTSFLGNTIQLVKHLKAHCPNAILVIGGPAYTLFPERLMELMPELDIGFFQEADLSFSEFVDAPDNVANIPGIYRRTAAGVTFTGQSALVDLNTLRLPDFDLFSTKHYSADGLMGVGLETKRGCTMQCLYCSYPQISGRILRIKNEEQIAEELNAISRHDVKSFFWVDSIFNPTIQSAIHVCNALKKANQNLTWGAYFSEVSFNADIANYCYETGCRQFFFSPDGISKKTRATLRRPVKTNKLKEVYRLAKTKKNTHLHISFLLGTPNENVRDYFEFTQLLLFLIFQLRILRISMSLIRIYPGTPISQLAIKEGQFKHDNDLVSPKYYINRTGKIASMILHPIFRGITFILQQLRAI